MQFSCSGGGHIGLFMIRPPEGHLNLFAMVFGNLIPIPITIPNFKNLSPSARFYEFVPCYLEYSDFIPKTVNTIAAKLHWWHGTEIRGVFFEDQGEKFDQAGHANDSTSFTICVQEVGYLGSYQSDIQLVKLHTKIVVWINPPLIWHEVSSFWLLWCLIGHIRGGSLAGSQGPVSLRLKMS